MLTFRPELPAQFSTGTDTKIDAWLERVATAIRPTPDSELHSDDQDWPSMPLSQLAYAGLGAATDHLSAICWHVEKRRSFPLADLTVCRSALVGAAEAVWLLAPDSQPERLKRARILAAEMLKRHSQYLTGLRASLETPDTNTELVADHVATRKAELDAKRQVAGERTALDTTSMIIEAANAAFTPALAAEAELEWRRGSGAAHGLAWSILGTEDTVQKDGPDADGLAEFQARGSLKRFSNGYFAAFHLAQHGWILLDRRNATGEPTESALQTEGCPDE